MIPLRRFQEAIRGALLHASVTSLCPADRIVRRRPRRAPTDFPTITIFDFGASPDAAAPPYLERTVQIDYWAESLQDANAVAAAAAQRLTIGIVAPLALPEIKLQYMQLVADRDDALDGADVVRKIHEYRCLGYQLLAA